jgi:hypothetical protein
MTKIYKKEAIKNLYGTGKEKCLSGYLQKIKNKFKIKYKIFKIIQIKTVE